MELSSGAYHFELIEFRHLQLAGTQKWALNPLGLCPQAQTPIIAPHSPGFTVPPTCGILLLPLVCGLFDRWKDAVMLWSSLSGGDCTQSSSFRFKRRR